NGKSVYDIDFVDLKNKNEVDYQIDAETGKIIERSRDHMND
ncbi:TPA: PepSY domain-containing protein, partial [Streptococcus agalactiae]|nr:PepSY domain-containing protein [Streptococcus agalactiae]